jgi:hypothetical protein
MENRAKQSYLDAIEAIVDGIENGWNLAGADGVMRSKLQMVLAKEGESWWITALHNVGVTPPPSKP